MRTILLSLCGVLAVAASIAMLVGCAPPDEAPRADDSDPPQVKSDAPPTPEEPEPQPTASPASNADMQAIAEEAFVYGFPMVMNYAAINEYFINKDSTQYKCGFNELFNTAHVYTPADTAIVTPNSDTPYSFFLGDLRAEPVVFTTPEIEKDRYYSVQLVDLYTFNYGYIGSRATGAGGGVYMIAGPNWKGETPEGVDKVFSCETEFTFGVIRTQLFDAADLDNVKTVQAGYKLQTLSSYLEQPAPPAASEIDWPKVDKELAASDPFRYLNFVLQFCPAAGPAEAEAALRSKFAAIGVEAGKPFPSTKLTPEQEEALKAGMKAGGEKIEQLAATIGKDVNGWLIGSAFGDREFFQGDWTLRAAAAKLGIYGNDAVEATYPLAKHDADGEPLDGGKHNYTLTFAAGELPPVNAFWSVTMYDGKTQLLIENPIDRYLINSPMLPELKKNDDGSLTLYIQKESPGEEKESNWLPAPDGPIYMVMRLYWPKPEPPSVLPPGEGTWRPPSVVRVEKAVDKPAGAASLSLEETRAIAEEGFIYGLPIVMNYAVMYEYSVDKDSGQYKAPFNTIKNETQVFTYKDTAIVTPNSDTPYSFLWMDLRAEPMVISVPAVEKERYYAVQLEDGNTFNYGYIGSRATGPEAGDYLVAGPDWKGETPPGVKKVFRSSTQFSVAGFRTQLFNPADMPNVVKVQAGYKAQPLSAFLKQPAPKAAPEIDFPKIDKELVKTGFFEYLDFALQFAPAGEDEKAIRAKLAKIGVGPGKKFDFKSLSPEQKEQVALGMKAGAEKIDQYLSEAVKEVNGWKIGAYFGDREFFDGNWLLRAAGAQAGIYGNDAVEATYPLTRSDADGQPLDGSKHNYTLTFAAGELPPVNAFWSVTMYDGQTQLLIENPINRYLINSPMLPDLKKNEDGSLTIYIQKDSPGEDKESNWLPAPDGPIYLAMRLYWPKPDPPSVLPPGEGTWKPPAIARAK
ncbi:MAG: DUF1254 domain-containing protein [Pirellulaceae bacterium]